MKKHEKLGQVPSPKWIINEILDLTGYKGKDILNKYIIEPSSGEGNFLLVIVERYINEALKESYSLSQIKTGIEKYIYGIELYSDKYEESINRLNEFIKEKFNNEIIINWKIYNGDTVEKYKNYPNFFDFVVGNPPYVRIHDLKKEERERLKNEFMFIQGSMNLYMAFFEMGFNMLKEDGILGFITPNSLLHNVSNKNFREYVKDNKALKTIVDFKSNIIFEGFSTYTTISIIKFNNNDNCFDYKELVEGKIKKISTINFDKLKSDKWLFSNNEDINFIENLDEDNEKVEIKNYFDVQYGFATLRDKIFIGKTQEKDKKTVVFNDQVIENGLLKKIIKGSTYKGNSDEIKYIIFPYVKKGDRYTVIEEDDLKNNYPLTYEYFCSHREELMKRDADKGAKWYEFGRSQGVQIMQNEKAVCNTLMSDKLDFHKLSADVMVYSGIFITRKNPNADWDILFKTLNSEKFKRYIRITGKDFSKGYKSVTSKQIKQFKIEKIEA